MEKVLIIEDDELIAELERDYLEAGGFQVEIALDGTTGLQKAQTEEYGTVVLDVMLPGKNGFEICRELRRNQDLPIIMVTARREDVDKIRGLGLGADDYMVKPFLPRELILRIGAILKRTYFPKGGTAVWEEELLTLGDRTADFKSGVVRREDKEIPLTAKEMLILRKLWENKGNIVTFDQICQAVWEDNYFGYENTIMVHIRRLREKIEENPSKPRFLLTVRGLGYKLKV